MGGHVMKKVQEITRSTEIEAEPDVCYAAVCDIQGYLSWFRHVKSLDIRETNSCATMRSFPGAASRCLSASRDAPTAGDEAVS